MPEGFNPAKLTLKVSLDDAIAGVKRKIGDKFSLADETFYLAFADKRLRGVEFGSLATFDITHESILHLNEAFARINAVKAIPDILSALYGNSSAPVQTHTDLICLIIDKRTSLFHPTPREASYCGLDYLVPFSVGISECASTQTDLANSMSYSSRELQRHLAEKTRLLQQSFGELLYGAKESGRLAHIDEKIDEEIRTLSDTTKETKCLETIKDILDELNSVSYFFNQQMGVLQTMAGDAALQRRIRPRTNRDTEDKFRGREGTATEEGESGGPAGDIPGEGSGRAGSQRLPAPQPADHIIEDSFEDMEAKFQELAGTPARRSESVGHLRTQAFRVYKDLCDILDLKQK
ncbi:hypothetical protein OQA88_13214 [Cercophora sp. LCS_1]